MAPKILVTGGAGYIRSQALYTPVVLEQSEHWTSWGAKMWPPVVVDIADGARLPQTINEYGTQAIIHGGSRMSVRQSRCPPEILMTQQARLIESTRGKKSPSQRWHE